MPAISLAKVPYHYLANTQGTTPDQLPYMMIRAIIAGNLPDLVDVEIAVAYHNNMNADADGKVDLGKVQLLSDPARQICQKDAIIIINETWWVHHTTSDEMRKAMIHHQLMHIGVRKDDSGEVKKDEKGRVRLYTRKHNIEEFREVIQEHGLYVDDLAVTCRIMQPHLVDETVETDEGDTV
jgi:hypothetical protein